MKGAGRTSGGSRPPSINKNDAAEVWFASQGWRSLPFQREVWKYIAQGKSGLLNAPTGTGKTYAIWGGVVNKALRDKASPKSAGLRAIWITPLRALANEIADSAQRMCNGTGLNWTVGTRTGDQHEGTRSTEEEIASPAGHHAGEPARAVGPEEQQRPLQGPGLVHRG